MIDKIRPLPGLSKKDIIHKFNNLIMTAIIIPTNQPQYKLAISDYRDKYGKCVVLLIEDTIGQFSPTNITSGHRLSLKNGSKSFLKEGNTIDSHPINFLAQTFRTNTIHLLVDNDHYQLKDPHDSIEVTSNHQQKGIGQLITYFKELIEPVLERTSD